MKSPPLDGHAVPAKCSKGAAARGMQQNTEVGSRKLKHGQRETRKNLLGVSRGCTWVCVRRRNFIAGVEPAVGPCRALLADTDVQAAQNMEP